MLKCQTFHSVTLDQATFDPERDAIRVRFRNGKWYEYTVNPDFDGPTLGPMEQVFDELAGAEHPGTYFHQVLRNSRRFRASLIPDPEVQR